MVFLSDGNIHGYAGDIHRFFVKKRQFSRAILEQCYDGKLYVSAVLDCFNGEILSIAMDSNMKKELCIRTVKELEMQYGKKLNGAIFHSDRGSQYTSEAFRSTLREAGLVQSLKASSSDTSSSTTIGSA